MQQTYWKLVHAEKRVDNSAGTSVPLFFFNYFVLIFAYVRFVYELVGGPRFSPPGRQRVLHAAAHPHPAGPHIAKHGEDALRLWHPVALPQPRCSGAAGHVWISPCGPENKQQIEGKQAHIQAAGRQTDGRTGRRTDIQMFFFTACVVTASRPFFQIAFSVLVSAIWFVVRFLFPFHFPRSCSCSVSFPTSMRTIWSLNRIASEHVDCNFHFSIFGRKFTRHNPMSNATGIECTVLRKNFSIISTTCQIDRAKVLTTHKWHSQWHRGQRSHQFNVGHASFMYSAHAHKHVIIFSTWIMRHAFCLAHAPKHIALSQRGP